MTGESALDHFLNTDPRDVGCEQALPATVSVGNRAADRRGGGRPGSVSRPADRAVQRGGYALRVLVAIIPALVGLLVGK